MAQTMRLSAAVELYKEQVGAHSNAYDWYRRSAVRDGAIAIAGVRIATWKDRGAWVVATADLERALIAHREEIELRQLRTSEYDRHVLHAEPGEVVDLDWAYVHVAKGFHRVSAKYEPPPSSPGTWHCTACWRIAETEHDREECHTCSDWGGCGRDCTLSRIYCTGCGGSMLIA